MSFAEDAALNDMMRTALQPINQQQRGNVVSNSAPAKQPGQLTMWEPMMARDLPGGGGGGGPMLRDPAPINAPLGMLLSQRSRGRHSSGGGGGWVPWWQVVDSESIS